MFYQFLLLTICFFYEVCSVVPTYSPTRSPTYSPTVIPTPVVEIPVTSDPIAQSQLVVINPGSNAVIQLKFFDTTTTKMKYFVTSVPESGTLYQLSQVFSNYGYEPKNGEKITSTKTQVTGSNNRVYYSRNQPDAAGLNKWGTFSYVVVRESDGAQSELGTVTLVPPSGNIVGSNFLVSDESWTISGNKALSMTPTFEKYSRGALLNYYIVGTDDVINVPQANGLDKSLWYFEAPSKFYGNLGISYGGNLQFNIGSFSGDFSRLNDLSSNVVILECEECVGPVGKGITLGYTMATLFKSPNGVFDGTPKKISIQLTENGGWLKDPQNTLKAWSKPSKCDVIQVLSRLSKIRILGDWTSWYETVAIDNIQISNTKAQLPVCAMTMPDASICTC